MQNVLKDEETYELVLKRDDLTGCPDSLVEAAKGAAEERNKEDDEYVITLSRSLVEPFLTFSDRQDLRKIAFKAWTTRGEMSPERDNLAIAVKILKLRREQAKLHSYSNIAEYQCVDRMAKTPQAVTELLENVWGKAKASANSEREALEEYVKESGEDLEGGIQAWDWRYCAEKVQRAKYDFDESLLKPYLSLESVTEAAFAISNKLFGLGYIPRPDIPTYHEDVKTYEVRDTNDKLIAVFVHDNCKFEPLLRSTRYLHQLTDKIPVQMRGRRRMAELGCQSTVHKPKICADADEVNNIPIVCNNNNNFAKGSKTLLSFDDGTTLFHEFVSVSHRIMNTT
jgi:peptidyl-dipeptidase Dcp